MIKLLNWTGVRPLTSKSSVLFLKRFFGVTIIVLTLTNTVFARYADNEEKEKPGKPAVKKDSTDSATSNKDYVFKDLFETNTSNATQANVTQLRPEAVSFVQDYIRKEGKELTKMKGWAQPYFQMMDGILTSFGIPKEMKYLAVIESHLSSYDLSWAGAVGPWQFMPETGRLMGLRIDGYVDERTSHVKSTYAAAKYLRDLYKEFGDWLLVIAAYNGGAGNVNYAIRKSKSRDFWALQYFLPEESRNHVKKFIATHYIMEGNGGITTVTKDEAKELALNATKSALTDEELKTSKSQTIGGKYNSLIISKNIGMDIVSFSRYNPDFDKIMASANNSYDLKLPSDKMDLFVSNKYQILNESVQHLLADEVTAGDSKAVAGLSRK